MKKYRSIRFFLTVLLSALFLNASANAEGKFEASKKAKVVFIAGKPSHGPMAHEHRAGNMILADALKRSGLNVECAMVPHPGYPEDPTIFDGASSVVIFCTEIGYIVPPLTVASIAITTHFLSFIDPIPEIIPADGMVP